jgi:hypothetical protein
MFERILIPTDGSAVARKAIKAGIAYAKEINAPVVGYYAVEAARSRRFFSAALRRKCSRNRRFRCSCIGRPGRSELVDR